MRFSFLKWFVWFGIGCESDKIMTVYQEPPVVSIQEPTVGTQFYVGEEINFIAQLDVFDGSAMDSFTHQWMSGTDVICPPTIVDDNGFAICTYAFENAGEQSVSVNIVQLQSTVAQAYTNVAILENEAPMITIITPADGDILPSDDLILFEAIVDDEEDDAPDLIVSLRSSIDGEILSQGAASSSGEFTTAHYLSVGEHLITMRVEDLTGLSDQDSVLLTVYEHGPPSLLTVGFSPSNPYTTDDILAVTQGWSDMEGSVEQNTYKWFYLDENNQLIEDPTEVTDSYPNSKTQKGDLFQVEVTPFNAYGFGSPVMSSVVEVANSPPTQPSVSIQPASPQPEDSLQCVAFNSSDADMDAISYEYAWFVNGVSALENSAFLDSSNTTHGDVVECRVEPFDGESYGPSETVQITVIDTLPPDPPLIDTPIRYSNEQSLDLEGLCEANCDLTFYCNDPMTSWSDVQICDGNGTFLYSVQLNLSQETTCEATCEDSAGNVSSPSNVVVMEACDPQDVYEGFGGDSATNAVDQWGSLPDDASQVIIVSANILDDDTDDWFVVSATDDVNQDLNDGLDYFRFHVEMTSGMGDYSFTVYRGSPSSSDLECSSTGYTEYDDFAQDVGDGSHPIPAESRACANGSELFNECEDNSRDYFIHVFRKTAVNSCQGYDLNISNGVW